MGCGISLEDELAKQDATDSLNQEIASLNATIADLTEKLTKALYSFRVNILAHFDRNLPIRPICKHSLLAPRLPSR